MMLYRLTIEIKMERSLNQITVRSGMNKIEFSR